MRWGWILAVYGAVSLVGNPRAALVQMFQQREVIAACLVLEAGVDGRDGMQAVMDVIQNRAKGKSSDYYAVVTQPWQFSALSQARGIILKDYSALVAEARHSEQWQTAVQLVSQSFSGNLADITGGATHYYSLKSSKNTPAPYWADDLIETITIGNHRFMKHSG